MKLTLKDIETKLYPIFVKQSFVTRAWVFEEFATQLFPSDNANVSIYIEYPNWDNTILDSNTPTLQSIFNLEKELERVLKRKIILTTIKAVNDSNYRDLILYESKLIYTIFPDFFCSSSFYRPNFLIRGFRIKQLKNCTNIS